MKLAQKYIFALVGIIFFAIIVILKIALIDFGNNGIDLKANVSYPICVQSATAIGTIRVTISSGITRIMSSNCNNNILTKFSCDREEEKGYKEEKIKCYNGCEDGACILNKDFNCGSVGQKCGTECMYGTCVKCDFYDPNCQINGLKCTGVTEFSCQDMCTSCFDNNNNVINDEKEKFLVKTGKNNKNCSKPVCWEDNNGNDCNNPWYPICNSCGNGKIEEGEECDYKSRNNSKCNELQSCNKKCECEYVCEKCPESTECEFDKYGKCSRTVYKCDNSPWVASANVAVADLLGYLRPCKPQIESCNKNECTKDTCDDKCKGLISTPICDPKNQNCVQCLKNEDCKSSFRSKCSTDKDPKNRCVKCKENTDCAHIDGFTKCDTDKGRCVECKTDVDCKNPVAPHCTTKEENKFMANTCGSIPKTKNCSRKNNPDEFCENKNSYFPYCDLVSGKCVQCNGSYDCLKNFFDENGIINWDELRKTNAKACCTDKKCTKCTGECSNDQECTNKKVSLVADECYGEEIVCIFPGKPFSFCSNKPKCPKDDKDNWKACLSIKNNSGERIAKCVECTSDNYCPEGKVCDLKKGSINRNKCIVVNCTNDYGSNSINGFTCPKDRPICDNSICKICSSDNANNGDYNKGCDENYPVCKYMGNDTDRSCEVCLLESAGKDGIDIGCNENSKKCYKSLKGEKECVECINNDDCFSRNCNQDTHTCVKLENNNGCNDKCNADRPVCYAQFYFKNKQLTKEYQCVECTSYNDEKCTGDTNVCNLKTNKCVECTNNRQCDNSFLFRPNNLVCDLNKNECIEVEKEKICNDNAFCANNKVNKICNTANEPHVCVECTEDSQNACIKQNKVCDITDNKCYKCTNKNEGCSSDEFCLINYNTGYRSCFKQI